MEEELPTRVVMFGDREWFDYQSIEDVVATFPPGTIVIEGQAPGADIMSRVVAEAWGFVVIPFPAQWDVYGKTRAGPIRNRQMITEGKPDIGIYFHNDLKRSKGTKDMIQAMKAARLPVYSAQEWIDAHERYPRDGQQEY